MVRYKLCALSLVVFVFLAAAGGALAGTLDRLEAELEYFAEILDQARASRAAHPDFLADLESVLANLEQYVEAKRAAEAALAEPSPPTTPSAPATPSLPSAEADTKNGELDLGGVVEALLPWLLGLSGPAEEDPGPAVEEGAVTEADLVEMLADIGVDYWELTEEERRVLREEYSVQINDGE